MPREIRKKFYFVFPIFLYTHYIFLLFVLYYWYHLRDEAILDARELFFADIFRSAKIREAINCPTIDTRYLNNIETHKDEW